MLAVDSSRPGGLRYPSPNPEREKLGQARNDGIPGDHFVLASCRGRLAYWQLDVLAGTTPRLKLQADAKFVTFIWLLGTGTSWGFSACESSFCVPP